MENCVAVLITDKQFVLQHKQISVMQVVLLLKVIVWNFKFGWLLGARFLWKNTWSFFNSKFLNFEWKQSPVIYVEIICGTSLNPYRTRQGQVCPVCIQRKLWKNAQTMCNVLSWGEKKYHGFLFACNCISLHTFGQICINLHIYVDRQCP